MVLAMCGRVQIAVHANWAPLGSAQFLSMVNEGFFNAEGLGVALFRCVRNWIVQFGLSSSAAMNAKFEQRGSIRDDPQWLPEGS